MPQITLRPHQQKVNDFLTQQPFGAVFVDMGGGKTLSILELFNQIRPAGHILLIAPPNIARSTWVDEIDKWGYSVRVVSLVEDERGRKLTREQRYALYEQIPNEPASFYLISRNLVEDLVGAMPTTLVSNGTGRRTRVPIWPFPTVVVDESQSFKSSDSNRFKALASVRPAISRMALLTGTPMPNGYEDLWSQIYLLDMGASLGTKEQYMARYFVPDRYVKGRPVSYRLIPGADKQIQQAIRHLCFTADNLDLGLPEMIEKQYEVQMDPEAMKMYLHFRKKQYIKLSDGHTIDSKSAGVLRSRLLQFASGTLYINEQYQYIVTHEAKSRELSRIMTTEVDTPALLVYRTRPEKRVIQQTMRDLGIQCEVFDGSRKMLQRWNDRQIQTMIIHPDSAGHGLNLQYGGRHIIWYALPDSSEQWKQTNRRLHRPGQTEQVIVHYLITRNTIDATQPARLDEKITREQQFKEAMMDEDPNLSVVGPITDSTDSNSDTGDFDITDDLDLSGLGQFSPISL